MNIIVFGASGKVGRLVVAELLARGHDVTAFVHSHAPPAADRLRTVRGDIYDRASIESAVAGHDAIVSALGSWGTAHKNVLATAMEKIIPAAEQAGIRRIVSLTGDGAQAPGEHISPTKHLTHALLNMVAPRVLRDGEDHIAMLAQSGLDWTVVRSPVMTSQNRNSYRLSPTRASLTIPRRAVAHAIADLVEAREWLQQAPFLKNSGDRV